MPEKRKQLRGFAAMTPERRREVAAKGARTAQRNGTAHKWTSDTARAAGRKSGARRREKA